METRSDEIPPSSRELTTEAGLAGRIIGGRYRLDRILGTGGMGSVYEAMAIAERAGERVAIKVISPPPGQALDLRAVKRFVREARLASQIDHENVTRTIELVHDADLAEPYLVMELLEGQDLARVLAEKAPLRADTVAAIGVEAARGLDAAHRHGIVHRDVKPQNLFLHRGPGGRVTTKVCDFGVAKLTEVHAATDQSSLTHSGGLVGSPRYMSPEQAQGAKDLDVRTDVWSLSVTLFEALSGRRLWEELDTLGEIIVAICTKDIPRLDVVAPCVDRDLAAIIHRGLARERDMRWPDMGSLASALEGHRNANRLTWDDLETVSAVDRDRPLSPIVPSVTRVDATMVTAPGRRKQRVALGVAGVTTAGLIALVLRAGGSSADEPAFAASRDGTATGNVDLAAPSENLAIGLPQKDAPRSEAASAASAAASAPMRQSAAAPSASNTETSPRGLAASSARAAAPVGSGTARAVPTALSAAPVASSASLPTREDWR